MTAPPNLNDLKLSVTNLGPIARADIDLRPMTVFVGPSNTGKSYMAMLVYALHGFFSGKALHPGFRFGFEGSTIFSAGPSSSDDLSISDEDVESLAGWLSESLSDAGTGDSKEAVSTVLPKAVAKLIRIWIEDVGVYYESVLDAEFARCFGVEDSTSLIRHGAESDGQITVSRLFLGKDGAPTSFGYGFSIRDCYRKLTSYIPDNVPLRFLANDQRYQRTLQELHWLKSMPRDNDDERAYFARGIIQRLAEGASTDLISPLSRAAYYLPADRTGVMHAHRVVVRSIIGQASRAGLRRDMPLPQLSGVLADFLEELIGLGDQRGTREAKFHNSLAGQIEKDILQGKISMEQSPVGYPEFFYRPEGWEESLGLMNTSSMVSELAPVVLYLRHVVRPGEVLIIEEPESCLHPAMQVEFIRQLAAAVHAGVRVMITTHSEWVLDELTNLARLGQLPRSRREGLSGADFALDPEMLGVWLFRPKKSGRGSEVEEIPFDEDFGGFRSGFDDVAMGTYNNYAAISNRIEETKAEYRTR